MRTAAAAVGDSDDGVDSVSGNIARPLLTAAHAVDGDHERLVRVARFHGWTADAPTGALRQIEPHAATPASVAAWRTTSTQRGVRYGM
jgi:hypothetical protein